jgi:Fibronectin type III domain
MSEIVLAQEFVSSNEAFITWNIDNSIIFPSSKGILYLTDISKFNDSNLHNTEITSFPIIKYQIRYNELSSGGHIFDNLTVGSYIAEISIINGTETVSSDSLEVNVYSLDAPTFSNIISGDERFTVELSEVGNLGVNDKVTFILLGKLVVAGVTQSALADTRTFVFSFDVANNTYILNSNLENNIQYELACFYTNSVGISSNLSSTKIAIPTNLPNIIANLTTGETTNNSVTQEFIIAHEMPNDASDYVSLNCRATITNTSNNAITYYYSADNSALLDPSPVPADDIVFNMNNQNLLPVDTEFTVKLAIENNYGYSQFESPAITCIHPLDFCSQPVYNSDLTFNVGLTSFSTSDNLTYYENNVYTINYEAKLFECDSNGDRVGEPVYNDTQTNKVFNITELTTGTLYNFVLNVYYVYTFSDSTTVTFNPQSLDVLSYFFRPHTAPVSPTLSAVPDDNSVTVNWNDLSTEELKGYVLDHYEVKQRLDSTWNQVGTDLTFTFVGLDNGTEYTFDVRAVTAGYNYNNNEYLNSATASISVKPFGTPSTPILVSQLPGDSQCTIVLSLPAEPYNGGIYDHFEASVNSSEYVNVIPTISNDEYTFVIGNLVNLEYTTINITFVTHNQTYSNLTKNSIPLIINTTPFALPDIPANFSAVPYTTSVELSWSSVIPAEIISNNVKYEFGYKLASDPDSAYVTVSNITSDTYTVTGLTSNSSYNFKIRSTVVNAETGFTFYSNYSNVITSRPFVYLNQPVMELVPQNDSIKVKLSPNVNNYFQGTFNYYATVTDLDGLNPSTRSALSVTNTNVVSLTFDGLTDLTQYNIVAYYEMYNTETSTFYSSVTVSNITNPYDASLAPVLTSASDDQSIVLTWDVTTMAGYTIVNYELSSDGDNWSEITGETQNSAYNYSLTVASLTNGQTYTHYVRAKTTQTEGDVYSASSNMVTNIPFVEPSSPIIVSSEPSNGQIILTWSAPLDLGGLGLDHYEVKKNSGSWVDVGVDLSYTFSELTNGTSYSFYVRAVTIDIYGNNALYYSSSSSVVNTPFLKADAPAIVSCVVSDEQAVLTWSEPALYGLPLDHYEVQQDSGSWVPVDSDLSYTFSGLTNGTSYTFRVKAYTLHPVLGLIEGLIADSVNSAYHIADAPTVVSCVPSDEQVVLTWSEPDLYGLPLDHYEVQQDSGSWVSVNLDLSHMFTGLTNGTSYTFHVRAVTSHPVLGLILGLAADSTNTPYLLAAAPTVVSCVPSDEQVILNWSAPALYGLPLDHYEVQQDSGSWVSVGFDLSHTFTGLTNGTSYTFRVKAYTLHPVLGLIEGESSVDATNTPYLLAAAPTIVSCVPDDEQVVLTWSAPALYGLPLDHYEVQQDSGSWVSVNLDLSYTFTGLTNGTSYTFHVRAVTLHPVLGLIEGDVADATNTPYLLAAAPPISSCDSGSHQVFLVWLEPDLHGLPLDHYEVQQDSDSWFSVGGYQSNMFSGLTNGTSYTFRVKAFTLHPVLGVIEGESSVDATNTPYLLAAAPTVVSCVPSDQQVILTWSEPALYGLPLDHYEVQQDSGSWVSVDLDVSHTFTGLDNGTSYTFRVKAFTLHPVLGLIEGDSSVDATRTPFIAPLAIENLVASARNNFVTVTFTAPSKAANNNTFTQYFDYSLDNFATVKDIAENLNDTVAISNDLTAVRVRCYFINPNDNTDKIYGPENSISVKNVNITSPENLKADVTETTITLSWNHTGSSYKVIQFFSNGTSSENIISSASYTYTGLTTGQSYNFGVSIITSGSVGPMASISATPLGKPTVTSKSKTGDNLFLTVNFNGASSVSVSVVGNNVDTGDYVIVTNDFGFSDTIFFPGMTNYGLFVITVSNILGLSTTVYLDQ